MKIKIPSGEYCCEYNISHKYIRCKFLSENDKVCFLYGQNLEFKDFLAIKCERCKAKEKIEVEYE